MSLPGTEQLLVCPCTGGSLADGWASLLKNHGDGVEIDDMGILLGRVPEAQGVAFHLRMEKGAALRELQHKRLHLAYWETPYYKEAITRFLGDISPVGKVALDVGCGDGRFTELLIEMGYDRVIAVDADLKPLRSLAEYAEEKSFRDKLLLIQSSVEHVPIRPGTIDVALAVEVFFYLNDRLQVGLEHVANLLSPGGTLLDSEPDMEGEYLKALIFENLPDFLRVLEESSLDEPQGGEVFQFRFYGRDELLALYDEIGLEVVDSHGLSIIPLILRIGLLRGLYDEGEMTALEPRLWKALDYLDDRGSAHRRVMWKTRRRT